MQNFSQQNGPTVTATPHVKPPTHGDSGTRSQSLSAEHSAVHNPLAPVGYMLPGGGDGFVSGTRRQVRETQSSDGAAMTTSLGSVSAVPRSQMRPTALPVHALKSASAKTSAP